jgi:MoxR-like ATPase
MREGSEFEPADLEQLSERIDTIRRALAAVVVGQEQVVDQILTALFTGGHVLLEGVPGVAKTLIARGVAAATGLQFRRIQFTPDLMPADIVGTNVFEFQAGRFRLQKGPVFTQVLLADEINRTPPKTQAALLEAMAEGQVTIDGETHALAEPFFVMATQNPLEHEGTYPLPEAQLDRFLMKVLVGYPDADDEVRIYQRFLDGTLDLLPREVGIQAVLAAEDVAAARGVLGRVHVEEKVLVYVRTIVEATRASRHLSFGASPRAGMALIACGRTRAALDGRDYVIPDDVKGMAPPVLRHRLLPTPEAELEGRDAEKVLEEILDETEVPR